MTYKSEAIGVVLPRLNVQYFLPAIQREFVWSTDQVIKLFDSIMRRYPISTFLFWELENENRSKWEVYKFIDNYSQKGIHSEPAETDGVVRLTLALDGQQRLTSLFIGLKGTYTVKRKYKRPTSSDAWLKLRLYLNLLKDPLKEPDDDEKGIRYGFSFLSEEPKNDADSLWIKVGHILDYKGEDQFLAFRDDFIDKMVAPDAKEQANLIRRNLDRLHSAIWKDEVISYYLESEQDYDRVLDIFVRANDGGTTLSKSDLLLSMVTSKWTTVNAREEIHSFVDRLNNELLRKNNFSKDFVLKACLTLCDLPVKYRIENFTVANLNLIEASWANIKLALEGAVKLINGLGLHADNLTSANSVIPIAYYLYRRPGVSLLGSSGSESKNRSLIHRWIVAALLNRAFSGQSDTVLANIRELIGEKAPADDFPADDIAKKLKELGKDIEFDNDEIENLLSLEYGEPETLLLLTILCPAKSWTGYGPQSDHIFPQAHFTSDFMTSAGIDSQKQSQYLEAENKVGNLQLLIDGDNQEKLSKDFKEWLSTRSADYLRENLIPENQGLYTFDKFLEFIQARNELISAKLGQIFVPQEKAAEQEK